MANPAHLSRQAGRWSNVPVDCLASWQTEAAAAAQAAETRAKHLGKQLAEQQRALAKKEKEGGKLEADLAKGRRAVDEARTAVEALGFDPEAAAALEAGAEAAKAEVSRCRERVDELSAQLQGERGL
jgi:septal ring factor EnvC (AmiA/AmiB activator)